MSYSGIRVLVKQVSRNCVSKSCVRSCKTLRAVVPFEVKSVLTGKPLAQILEERNAEDPTLNFKVDIGLPPPQRSRSQELKSRLKVLADFRSKTEVEKLARLHELEVPLEDVEEEWLKSEGPYEIRKVAEHYGVYQDLFGDAYFVPYLNLNISYLNGDNKNPVYRGNVLKPSETVINPEVSFESDQNSLWTLILTNPDGHFTNQEAEYVHWFVGNIPGNSVSKGDVIVEYLQPFPPKGTGFHRMIFILYKQEKKMDYSNLRRSAPCLDLEKRTFNTYDFYQERQEDLTPAGLAFFQTDWDPSLSDFFHFILKMKEPSFEYDFPPPYLREQEWFPKKRSFNEYMDKYRDPKQIAKEYLMKKFKTTHPFKKPEPKFPYQGVFVPHKIPSWIKQEMEKEANSWGRSNDFNY